VAAVFIGAIAFVWNMNSSDTVTSTTTTATKKTINEITATRTDTDSLNINKNAVADTKKKEAGIINAADVDTKQSKKQNGENNFATPVTKDIVQTLNNQSTIPNNNQSPVNNTQTQLATNNTVKSDVLNSNNTSAIAAVSNTINNTQNTNNNTARQVVYKSLDGDDENNQSILVSGQEIKAPKLLGFLKKAIKVITPKETEGDDSKKLFAVTL
jgi:hypothetical protein